MEYFLQGVKIIIEPGEDGYFVAHVPSLKGCLSQGGTEEEALANIKAAISLHIEVLKERGESLPKEFRES
jgi:predicted RNase H-like HicB family nuclease